LLNTDIAQQTLKVVDRTFHSFYALISAVKSGSYQPKVRLPYYLPKEGYFVLIIPRSVVKDGRFNLPISNAFKKLFGGVSISFPERLNPEAIKEVRIHSKYNARFFEVEFVSKVEPELVETVVGSAISIDFGLDNLATCVDINRASFTVDGRKLKSINQWFNKEKARLQSIKDRQKIERINRNNQVRDYLNKTAKLIIDHCIAHKIERVIVGFKLSQKQEINIGSRNNQNFVQIPFHTIRGKLKSLCQRYGFLYLEQEESYTSQASALDGDDLPVYNADKPATYQFYGQRVKRGLYRAWEEHLINADCNGAANIGRKSKQNGFTGLSRGCAGTAITNLDPRLIAVLKNPLAFRHGSVKTT